MDEATADVTDGTGEDIDVDEPIPFQLTDFATWQDWF